MTNKNKSHDFQKPKRFYLPSYKRVKEAINRINHFRDVCTYQMDVGYWMTTEFPSKHHFNTILQLQYRESKDLVDKYGLGITQIILDLVPICKTYLAFVRFSAGDKAEFLRSKDEVGSQK